MEEQTINKQPDTKETNISNGNGVDVEKKSLTAILQDGVDFKITVANPGFLHKWGILPTEKPITIYPITLGTLVRISRLLLDMDPEAIKDLDSKENNINLMDVCIKTLAGNQETMVRIIAYGITNTEQEPSKGLLRYLRKNLIPAEMFEILKLIVQQMDIQAYLKSLVLTKGFSLQGKTN